MQAASMFHVFPRAEQLGSGNPRVCCTYLGCSDHHCVWRSEGKGWLM